ncbi:winged helix-turn-helix transcriptional regulator [Candidatus Acetothermia bacterium]|nr:winged helix-turn-helix transcriptional regulator [Candidatus Acetothermia bacterium]MBI3659931.1 winged helix-turn-helix transcriptional regulator [Candidatus Acetothermia bacterium]
MREIVTITKALANDVRLRILMMLSEGELCACQIIEVLDLAPSTVSKHLSILHQARLVDARKNGRWVYYQRSRIGTSPINGDIFRWLRESLKNDDQIKTDAVTLKKITKIGVEELCKRRAQKD